jgi:ketosteroid isomerase-like protein
MNRDEVMHWVGSYEQAWRDGDVEAVERLFTDEARYLASPYEAPKVGHDAIKAFWLDDEGRTFEMSASLVAVDGRTAIVRLEVQYGEPTRQEYRDLWVLRFGGDGRVEEFEEWAYWPGRPYEANPPA